MALRTTKAVDSSEGGGAFAARAVLPSPPPPAASVLLLQVLGRQRVSGVPGRLAFVAAWPAMKASDADALYRCGVPIGSRLPGPLAL